MPNDLNALHCYYRVYIHFMWVLIKVGTGNEELGNKEMRKRRNELEMIVTT